MIGRVRVSIINEFSLEALVAKNSLDDAVLAYQKAFLLAPTSPMVLLQFGNLLLKIGREEEALSYFRQYVKV